MLRRAFMAALGEDCVSRVALMGTSRTYPGGVIAWGVDSISRGFGHTAPAVNNWGAQMVDELSEELNVATAYNDGVDSRTLATAITDAPGNVDVLWVPGARLVSASAIGNIYLLFGGTNDRYFGATTEQVWSRTLAHSAARKAAGAAVLWVTMLRRRGTESPPEFTFDGFETTRLEIVSRMRTQWPNYVDGIVDCCDDAAFLNPVNPQFSDQTHLTDLGASILGRNYAAPAVRELLGL